MLCGSGPRYYATRHAPLRVTAALVLPSAARGANSSSRRRTRDASGSQACATRAGTRSVSHGRTGVLATPRSAGAGRPGLESRARQFYRRVARRQSVAIAPTATRGGELGALGSILRRGVCMRALVIAIAAIASIWLAGALRGVCRGSDPQQANAGISAVRVICAFVIHSQSNAPGVPTPKCWSAGGGKTLSADMRQHSDDPN